MRSSRLPLIPRLLATLLALCLLGGGLISCAQESEIPDGYQYATCRGEYFRLYVPTQWSVNTESGVSGAVISVLDKSAVSMAEVHFDKPVGTDEKPTTASLDDFVAGHLAEIETLAGYKADKDPADTTLGSYRAVELYYTVTEARAAEDGKMDYVPYRYRQVLTRVEGRFYLFTYSSSADSFDRWLDIVDGILENVMFYGVPFEGSEDEKELPAVDNVPDGMKLVSSNDVAYRFFAPESWQTVSGSAAAQVYVSDSDRSNVSVIGYVPDTEAYSVEDYWAFSEKEYRASLNDYKLLSTQKDAKMGGRNATVYEFEYTLGGVQYRARQAVCVYSYMVVSMTYTALPENYEAHMADVLAMQEALAFRR